MQTLKKELSHLRATNIVFELDLKEGDLRNDGLPRATAKLGSQAVVISFDAKTPQVQGPLRIYFAKYNDWTHNIRAIAHHLEHLRLSSLHGVGTDGEQYKGWKTITQTKSRFATKCDAAKFIMDCTGTVYTMTDTVLYFKNIQTGIEYTLAEAYRTAAARLHPDTTGGDHESFVALQEAKAMLEKK
jgi:hypothetical protein